MAKIAQINGEFLKDLEFFGNNFGPRNAGKSFKGSKVEMAWASTLAARPTRS